MIPRNRIRSSGSSPAVGSSSTRISGSPSSACAIPDALPLSAGETFQLFLLFVLQTDHAQKIVRLPLGLKF